MFAIYLVCSLDVDVSVCSLLGILVFPFSMFTIYCVLLWSIFLWYIDVSVVAYVITSVVYCVQLLSVFADKYTTK